MFVSIETIIANACAWVWKRNNFRFYGLLLWIIGISPFVAFRFAVPLFPSGSFPPASLLTIGLLSQPTAFGNVAMSRFGNSIQTTERLEWQWNWRAMVRQGGWITLMIGLVIAIAGSLPTLEQIGFCALLIGLAMASGGILYGFRRAESVHRRVAPNEGVVRSVSTSVGVAACAGLGGLLAASILSLCIDGSLPGHNGDFRNIGTALSVIFAASISSLFFCIGSLIGGLDVPAKHFVLRILLTLTEGVPVRLGNSLNHMCKVLLLRKVGGGFIFAHRYLLEFFASKYRMSDSKS